MTVANVISPLIKCEVVDNPICVSPDFIKQQFNAKVSIKSSLIHFKLETKKITLKILENKLSAKIVEVVVIESGVSDINSISFTFTQNDIVDNKLTKYHGLNSPIVDVSITDNMNNEIMLGLHIINTNNVEIDFTRVQVIGTWRCLIEK